MRAHYAYPRGPPPAGGIEVFESEADRIDSAVALGALRLFLVQPQPLAGGQRLGFEAGQLPSESEFVASIDKPVPADRKAPRNLTDAEVAALPVPPKQVEVRKTPQGANRDYPPLEAGRP